MGMNKPTQRLAAWIACLAILFAALAPAISHAVTLAKRSDISWMELCSATDHRFVQVSDSDGAPDSAAHHKAMQFEHCPFCSTHAGSFGLPPATASVLLLSTGAVSVMPPLFYQAPRSLFVWAPAQSRAPPSLS
jgi:hypothetical protein